MPSESVFVKYLEFRGVGISEMSGISEMEYSTSDEISQKIKIEEDSEIEKMAVKAFVSYVSSYKEYVLNYIIELSKLNFDGLMVLFRLRKVPKMKELRNVVFKMFPRK